MASPRGPGPLLVALGLLAGSLALARDRLEPPPALPIDAPPDQFSSGRARERLAGLLANDTPHPKALRSNCASLLLDTVPI